MSKEQENVGVLPKKFGGGPLGLGDPNDRTLRKVEKEVIISEMIREKAKALCEEQVKEFGDCCIKHGFMMVIKCRQENKRRKECLVNYYKDEKLRQECTEEYLNQRSNYRLTGIKQKKEKKK